MSRESAGRANFKKRWAGDGKRPGVQAVQPHGCSYESVVYAVVTAEERTEHDTFAEAAEEYRIRRVGLTGIRGTVGA